MTDHLDEDPGSWPSDPYKLLAVKPASDSRALRQAYTRLIRRFKPEHFPEQFRRIREAYETALLRLEYRAYFADDQVDTTVDAPDAPGGGDTADILEQPVAEGSPTANRQPRLVLKSVEERLEDIWAQLCAGDLPEPRQAYHELRELQLEQPRDEAIFVRLFWLLRVAPELDREHTALDWLRTGLAQGGPGWTLRELYRTEIDRDPILAFQAEFTNLLTAGALDTSALEDLLSARWQAAMRLGRVRVINEDLSVLRDAWSHRDEALWGRLLVRAAEHWVWTEGEDDEMAWLMAELDGLPHFQANLAGDLDRMDYLREIARDAHKLRSVGTISDLTLQRLLSAWQRPDHEAREMLLELAQSYVAGYVPPLLLFDQIMQKAPTLLAGVLNRLRGLVHEELSVEESAIDASSGDDPRDPKALAELVGNFFYEHPAPAFAGLRGRFLDFCIREAVDPLTAASILAKAPLLNFRQGENLSEAISRDVALQAIFTLHELVVR